MLCVKWDDFLNDINGYINKAYEIMGNINEYTVYKDV
jgi:hypothetical protein